MPLVYRRPPGWKPAQQLPLQPRRRGKDKRPRKKETPYRLTAARREAGTRNLRKANIERMFGCYLHPLTPAHEAKALASLKRADAARAVRGNYFRHGLYSALLPEAIRRAGENPVEFEAHVLRFERAFAPPGGKALFEDEASLIRAAAELVWRHIRAFRCQGDWERSRAALLLGKFDGYRIEDVQQAADMAIHLAAIFCWEYDGLAVPLNRLRLRLESVFEEIFSLRFEQDARFGVFRRLKHFRPDLEGKTSALAACPALPAWRVERVQAHGAARGQVTAALPEVSRWSRARRKDWNDLRKMLRRIFLAEDAREGTWRDRATRRLQDAVAWRLQPFPRQAQWQAGRVREILERAARAAPLSPRQAYATMRRILEMIKASDRVFDALPKYDMGVLEALQECVYAAYGRFPPNDPFQISKTARKSANTLIGDDV